MNNTDVYVVPTYGQPAIPDAGDTSLALISRYVTDDETAIREYLAIYKKMSPHTVRSYEKECRRFLLWLRARRYPSPAMFPDVVQADINEYLAFLENPLPFDMDFLRSQGWDHQPFRKPHSKESLQHCLTILNSMFLAMREFRRSVDQPYCMFNPVHLAHKAGKKTQIEEEIDEALTDEEWLAVQEAIEQLPRSTEREVKHYHRARWITQLLYRAYLRREEASLLTMGSFKSTRDGWVIKLVGKGDKPATIVATDKLMQELQLYRTSLGLSPLPSLEEELPAIMAVTGKDKGVTAQAIYLVCKVIFEAAADLIAPKDLNAARRLKMASPHWMRHTGVSHSMEAGVNPRYVQAQARHSSLKITARYDHKKKRAWRKELEESTAKEPPLHP